LLSLLNDVDSAKSKGQLPKAASKKLADFFISIFFFYFGFWGLANSCRWLLLLAEEVRGN